MIDFIGSELSKEAKNLLAAGVISGAIKPAYFTISGVVKLYPDGHVEFADGYTPETAAKEFWEHVAKFAGWHKRDWRPDVDA